MSINIQGNIINCDILTAADLRTVARTLKIPVRGTTKPELCTKIINAQDRLENKLESGNRFKKAIDRVLDTIDFDCISTFDERVSIDNYTFLRHLDQSKQHIISIKQSRSDFEWQVNVLEQNKETRGKKRSFIIGFKHKKVVGGSLEDIVTAFSATKFLFPEFGSPGEFSKSPNKRRETSLDIAVNNLLAREINSTCTIPLEVLVRANDYTFQLLTNLESKIIVEIKDKKSDFYWVINVLLNKEKEIQYYKHFATNGDLTQIKEAFVSLDFAFPPIGSKLIVI